VRIVSRAAAAALCAAACASTHRPGKSSARSTGAGTAPTSISPTARELLAKAAATWARIDRAAMTGADALQEVARDARTCADDARRAWRGLQPDGAAEGSGAAAQPLSQALARAGPDIAEPIYLTAACTSATLVSYLEDES